MNQETHYISLNYLNDQAAPDFVIMRDGQVDTAYYKAKQRSIKRSQARRAIISAFKAAGKGIKAQLDELGTQAYLNLYDAEHGTHLQRELRQQRQAEELAAMRAKFDIKRNHLGQYA